MTNENSTQQSQKKLEFPMFGIVPGTLLSAKNISPNAKLHFSCLTALAQKEGYCWATDDAMAEMHDVHRAQVCRWNKELEDAGFIRRETIQVHYRDEDGKTRWKKKRRIFIGNFVSPFQSPQEDPDSRKNATFANNFNPKEELTRNESDAVQRSSNVAKMRQSYDSRKNATYNKRTLKKETEEREGAEPPDPPARASSSPSVDRRPNVKTTDDEHQKLVTEYGEDEVEQMYDVLQEWKEDTPRSKWKKSDYRSIRRWVVDALKEKAKRGETRKETGRVEDNRAYSQKIAHDFMLVKGPEKFVDIRADANCITFSSTHPTADRRTSILAYKENGFRDQLDALLRKWRLL